MLFLLDDGVRELAAVGDLVPDGRPEGHLFQPLPAWWCWIHPGVAALSELDDVDAVLASGVNAIDE